MARPPFELESGPRATGLGPVVTIIGLGTVALAGWILVAFYLDPVGARRDVVALILVAFLELGLAAAAAAVLARRGDRASRGALRAALILAALFRLVLLPAGLAPGHRVTDLARDLGGTAVVYDHHLLYDNDVWRYLWDGRVQLAGFDPYRTTPASIEAQADAGDAAAEALLADERWYEIHQRIGYPAHPSVYPPLSQGLFAALAVLAPGSVAALKLVLIAADLGVCWLLLKLLGRLGRPRGLVVLYAWHPLPIKEIAGSAHLDALAALFLAAAVLALVTARERAALVAWAVAVMVKLSPLVLAGVFLARTPIRRWGWAPAMVGLLTLPYADAVPALLGSLRSFADGWRFNSGLWRLIGWLAHTAGARDPAVWADGVCRTAVVTVMIVAAGWVRGDDTRRVVVAVFAVLTAVVVLSPAVMPWYLLWALPFAVAAGSWPFVVFGALVFLSYLTYVDQQERLWWLVLEHGGFLVLMVGMTAVGWLRERQKRSLEGARS